MSVPVPPVRVPATSGCDRVITGTSGDGVITGSGGDS